ncbi:prolyl oligopeptidase family serine peptidase [Streptosporangium sp. NBC_01810]|uniref:alpha/beta hydrolase family protein n=1 Tax=Streptosporangium sp. NBC_01810 TaxID=2975951 RepID=UPI002DD8F173|nr:alpha/beta fold hydrolase [Streptosporangium sp. NBC_01810]WSA24694.1 prolyl oligopeptidase family serine peptidase [Streptosporangium sp. NBC_01810]
MTAALEAYAALAGLRVPEAVVLDAEGARVACVLPRPDGRPVAHVLDLSGAGAGAGAESGSRGPVPVPVPVAGTGTEWHALTRWLPDGRLLLAAGDGPDLDHVEVRSPGDPVPAWRVRVGGEIEDLVPGGDGTVLVRFADPGSERDGSHLGLRVRDETDPFVRTPGDRRRRLAWARVGDGELRTVPLRGLTVWDADWRDGVVLAVTSADETPAGYYRPALDLVDPESGELRTLLRTSWQLSRPRLAPGGRTAVVVEGLSIVSGRIIRVDLVTGEATPLAAVDDVTDLGWLDEDTLWFTGWSGTGTHGGTLTADGRPLTRWTSWGTLGGRDGQPSLSVDRTGALAVAVWETAECPPEVAVAQVAKGDWRQVTDLNAVLAPLAVHQEEVSWTGQDGLAVQGLLLRRSPISPVATVDPAVSPNLSPSAGPANPIGPAGPAGPAGPTGTGGTGAGPAPLVVIVHGGPTWLWSTAFAPAESGGLAAALAHAGAAVLLPNPRGSSGRGQEYARRVIGRFGEDDLGDVLAGVDHLVAAGVADPERMAVMGLSYGGYLSAWAVTRTGRFRAAVVMSGVSDWLSFATASNLGGGFDLLYHRGADPATPQGREFLAARSPVCHAAGVTTPTLILHGAEDRTTPVGQAEQLYRAWSAAGVRTQLVVYPREGHELTEGAHRGDAAERVVAWLTGNGVL